MPRPDSFNEGLESFTNYKERLDAFFIANDVSVAKQTSTLLSSIGPKSYNTLRSLTAPDLPSTKTYTELCSLLTKHFCPPPLEIVERFKFHKRNQGADESLSDFLAAIKRLSEHCNFGDNLMTSLRDRFVCGVKDEAIQKRLLQEQGLTLDKATALAFAMETAHRDAAEIHGNSPAVHKINVHHNHKAKQPALARKTFPPCQSCGLTNHKRSDCFLREAICKKCSRKGHIQKVCRMKSTTVNTNPNRKQRQVHELNEAQNNSDSCFTLDVFSMSSSKRTPKININLKINNVNTSMELDTGSAVSVMTKQDYNSIFKEDPKLIKTDIRLRTFTNEIIHPLGKVYVNVETNKQQKNLPLLILERGNNPIFGRDWLSELKVDWHHDISPTKRNIKQMSTTEDILSEFGELFSTGVGKIKDIKAHFNLKEGSQPKFFKARPAPYALKYRIESQLQALEKEGILSKVKTSQWATPIVPVMKKSGEIRICGDFKVTINPVLEAEQYTLPRIEDMMANLVNGQTFSKIDLRKAYHQLELDDESKLLTTINTHKGLYAYNRLVFGITSAPAIWQRTMDSILQGLPVQCNQDDIIVTGKTDDEHTKNLKSVLQRLQDHGLRANLDKCSFFQNSVVFCGMKITAHGIHKTEDKVRAVTNAAIPENKSQLRSFLGMVNYYHKWLKDVASIAKPLYDLLQENAPFHWTKSCSDAFETIKQMIASDQVLIKYDPDLPVTLATDASPSGIGAVLSHITKGGDERPIAYASRTLNKAEQKYSQLDKEALAIVWAVRKFFNYLCGRHFQLITDHKPLKHIFDPKKPIPAMSLARQQRYAVFLSGFDYSIHYRCSKSNANADGLSRLPMMNTSRDENEDADELYYSEIMDSIPINHQTVSKESRNDTLLSKIIYHVQHDEWPNEITDDLRPFASKRHELSIQHNCLLWGHRVIPPAKLRKQMLTILHQGHLGVVKMKNLARNYFWWPSLDKDIESVTKNCPGCATSKPDPPLSPLHPWQWPEQPWQRIHVDYAGPFMGSMFLIAVDAHTKWMEVIPTQNATSIATINILSDMFARFGLCQQLVSDNGAQFTSEEFKSFMKGNVIKHVLSAPYHPATNGLAERAVQSFKNAMKASKYDQGNLHTKIARFLFAYRNSPHSTTSESPAFLMLGRTLRSRISMLRPNLAATVNKNQQKQVNSHSHARLRTFNIGDHVLVRDYRKDQLWQSGIIHSSTGPLSSQVEISPGKYWRRHADQIVHSNVDKVKSSHSTTPPLDPTGIPYHFPVVNPSVNTDAPQSKPDTADNTTAKQARPSLSASVQDAHERAPVRGDNPSPQEHITTTPPYRTRSGPPRTASSIFILE